MKCTNCGDMVGENKSMVGVGLMWRSNYCCASFSIKAICMGVMVSCRGYTVWIWASFFVVLKVSVGIFNCFKPNLRMRFLHLSAILVHNPQFLPQVFVLVLLATSRHKQSPNFESGRTYSEIQESCSL